LHSQSIAGGAVSTATVDAPTVDAPTASLHTALTATYSTPANSAITRSPPTVRSPTDSLGQLSDEQLLAQTRQLAGHSNRVLAALLAHLAEVEARGVHRIRACSSLYTYCIYELRLSEDESARRVSAARLVKRFPALFVAVERGELRLTGLLLLGPHLTAENHMEVLARATHRTKKEIQKLVRELCPLPDVPACIEPLGPAGTGGLGVGSTWERWLQSLCPVRELAPGDRPADWLDEPTTDVLANRDADRSAAPSDVAAPARVQSAPSDVAAPARVQSAPSDVAAPARVEPTLLELRSEHAAVVPSVQGPQRYRVQFTASEEYVDLVERARALLSHSVPNAPLDDLHVRAMRALVVELEKRRYALTKQPRRATPDRASSANNPGPAESAGREAEVEHHEGATQAEHDGGSHTGNGAARDAARERSRAVPAQVRRAAFERDGGRCTYVDDRGLRCRETHRLELHHVEPFGKGGAHDAMNVRLRCRAHNSLAAEQDFGGSFIRYRRDASRHESAVQARGPR
jgi:hypothetical protein